MSLERSICLSHQDVTFSGCVIIERTSCASTVPKERGAERIREKIKMESGVKKFNRELTNDDLVNMRRSSVFRLVLNIQACAPLLKYKCTLLYGGDPIPLPINQRWIQNIPFYHLLFAALRESGFLPAEPRFANYTRFLASSGLARRLPRKLLKGSSPT